MLAKSTTMFTTYCLIYNGEIKNLFFVVGYSTPVSKFARFMVSVFD